MRVAAYMHWVTDVLVGIIFGWICGYLPLLVFRESREDELEEGLLSDPDHNISSNDATGTIMNTNVL